MALSVRMMIVPEIDLLDDYFQNSPPEHLEMLGVDPTRLPSRSAWHERLEREFDLPVAKKSVLHLTWLLNDQPIGFSMSDKIVFGERANMHLHVVNPENRNRGLGTECVRRSVEIYFEALQLKRRAERLQRRSKPDAAKGWLQIREDAHDRAKRVDLSSGRHALGDQTVVCPPAAEP